MTFHLVPRLDLTQPEEVDALLDETLTIDEVPAYIITAPDVIRAGLPSLVEERGDAYYNHMAGAADAPGRAAPFARAVREAGASGVILSGMAGPDSLEAYARAARSEGLDVLAEPLLRHTTFLRQRGGHIDGERLIAQFEGLRDHFSGAILPADNPVTDGFRAELARLVDGSLYQRSPWRHIPDLNEVQGPEVVARGLDRVVRELIFAKDGTVDGPARSKMLVYDHEKLGTWTPESSMPFADAIAAGGVDAAMLVPMGGTITVHEYLSALNQNNVAPILGGSLPHSGYYEHRDDGVRYGGLITPFQARNMACTGRMHGAEHHLTTWEELDKIGHITMPNLWLPWNGSLSSLPVDKEGYLMLPPEAYRHDEGPAVGIQRLLEAMP